jgi:hypothetical protein
MDRVEIQKYHILENSITKNHNLPEKILKKGCLKPTL